MPASEPQIRVVLVGFMGAGKTTVGRLLAESLGCTFVDLDDRIVAAEGRKIAVIFRESGEKHFRAVESKCLRELIAKARPPSTRPISSRSSGASGSGMVLAVGGGAFVQPENVALLRQSGARLIFLDASLDELRRRCAEQKAERPLFRDENQFRQLYEARRSGYMAAELRIDTEGKTPDRIVEEITQVLASEDVR